jgi:hypothetical protein
MMITNIDNGLVLTIVSFSIYVPFLWRAAEIITYPRPTANPNASGIKTAAPCSLNTC